MRQSIKPQRFFWTESEQETEKLMDLLSADDRFWREMARFLSDAYLPSPTLGEEIQTLAETITEELKEAKEAIYE